MSLIFSVIREDTFWSILLFIHFLMAVALLAAVTLQPASVLTSARQVAGNFIDRFSPVPAADHKRSPMRSTQLAFSFSIGPLVVRLECPNHPLALRHARRRLFCRSGEARPRHLSKDQRVPPRFVHSGGRSGSPSYVRVHFEV
jgi:hypothetical protein